MQINSILINLPRRKDRLEHSKNVLSKFINESDTLEICPGVDMIENTTIAVREAHKKAVQIAKDKNFDFVLIIEDDIMLRAGAREYFDTLLNNLPKDFDVLLFGIYSGVILENEESQFWDGVCKFSGLHFYVVHKNAYDKILNYNGTQPIDHWIGENLNCRISKKHFAYQLDGWSDNAKTYTAYNSTELLRYSRYFLK